MRHRKAGRGLGRNSEHRLALFRNLALALFRHERIVTTVAKAKAVRPFVEKLITLARRGDLHNRRLAVSKLGPMSDAEVQPGDEEGADHRTILQKLFTDLGPRFRDRQGGYTRILKRQYRRLGDAGETAYLELLKEGEGQHRAKAKGAPPTPAPSVAPEVKAETPPASEPASTPAPETPPSETPPQS